MKDLWFFVIAVILISLTSAAIGSFVTGIEPAEFFLGDDENVLVLTPPGIATPMTGSIPISLAYDVNRVEGVNAVSAEVLGVMVAQNLNDRPIIIRGITYEFLNITRPLEMTGKWFDQIYNAKGEFCSTFGAVIGASLAENQDINIGSKLTLVSTLVPMTIELEIEGIITTGTPLDTELIVPLATAQAMTGRRADYVSFIRVEVNPTKVTKSELVDIVNGQYEVPIFVHMNDPRFEDNLSDIPIVAYSLAGEVIKTQLLDSNGETKFEIPFGTYQFIANPAFTDQSSPVEVFVNQSLSTPLDLWIGKPRHELKVIVTFNNQPAINATVAVREKFHPKEIYNSSTPTSGMVSFPNLIYGYYTVEVSHKGLSEENLVFLNYDGELRVTLENSLKIIIVNASSGDEVKGGFIQLLNVSNPLQVIILQDPPNNQSIIPYDSGEVLYIDEPQTCLVNYSIGNKWRTWQQIIDGNTTKVIHVGKESLLIKVFNTEGKALENSNVSVFHNGEVVISKNTNIDGIARFELEMGNYYEILAKNPQNGENKSSTIYFEFSKELFITFKQIETFWLEVIVYNGTEGNKGSSRLAGCNLILYNESGIINTTFTNENGTVEIPLSHSGKYYLNATYNEFRWSQEIFVSKEDTHVNIPLGDVKLKIITKTSSNFPIANVSIKIFTKNELLVEITSNDYGEAVLTTSLGDYGIIIEKSKFIEVIDLSFIESQILTIERRIDLTGTLSLNVANEEGKKLVGTTLIIENVLYNVTRSGMTNQNAEITFHDLPWGNYSVTAIAQGALYKGLSIGFTEEEQWITIQVSMSIEIIDKEISLLKWRGQLRIIVEKSKNFLSGFLITTLEVISTTLIALIVVVAVLSLLSVSSVISYPIATNFKNLQLIRTLGGSPKQIHFIISCQMTIIGVAASILGSYIGTLIMTHIDIFRLSNVGGLIITPTLNIEVILGITISCIIVTIWETRQSLSEIFNNYSKTVIS